MAGNGSGRLSIGSATWKREYVGEIVLGKDGKASELVLILQV